MGFSTLLLRDHFDQQLVLDCRDDRGGVRDGYAAGRLPRVRKRPPHPLVLAKELATLDRLSDGRGRGRSGAGWMGSDYEEAGLSYDAAGAWVTRMQESIHLIKAFFAGGPVNFTPATTTPSPSTRCIPRPAAHRTHRYSTWPAARG